MIAFTVPLIPTAKGRPQTAVIGGHARIFTPERTRRAETTFSSLAAPYAPAKPFEGPLALALHFQLPVPRGWPAWKRLVGPWDHDHKPDLDNLAKLVLDALQRSGAWWRDDAQVARLTCSKGYGDPPGTRVTIEQLEQPQRPARVAKPDTASAQAALFTEPRTT